MNKIIPGILETEWSEIEAKIEKIKPLSKTIHIDIIDGAFAPVQTFLDPKPFSKYADELLLEAHLMVSDPIKFLEPFANAGFKRFLGHMEKMQNVEEFVARGQLLGEVGLAIDIGTNIDDIKVNLDDLDCILVMDVKAGASAQTLIPEVFEKVKEIKKLTQIPIVVDGGVNDKNIKDLKIAGADRFVVNSFLFQNDTLAAFEKLSSSLQTTEAGRLE